MQAKSQLLILILCLLFAVFFPQSAKTESIEAEDVSCNTTTTIQAIEPRDLGLAIKVSGPAIARIVEFKNIYQDGLAGFSHLIVELPNASLGKTNTAATWNNGLFVSMRAVRYLRYEQLAECGVRLRLQPKLKANWIIQQKGNTIFIIAEKSSLPKLESSEPKTVARDSHSGSLIVSDTH